MNIEEIRKNAPSGATGYRLYGELIIYYMFDMPHYYRFKKSINAWVYCVMVKLDEIKPL